MRCQQVVRDNYVASDRLIDAIDPDIYEDWDRSRSYPPIPARVHHI
jgi:hypothetical protein